MAEVDADCEPGGECSPPLPPVPASSGTEVETPVDTSEKELPATDAAEEELQPPQQPVSAVEVAKWNEMMEGIGILPYIRAHPDRFRRRVRRGIPPQYRWEVWKAAMHLQTHEDILALDYRSLSSRNNPWTSVIEIDITRTFPELKSFGQNHQNQLWRVLNAYASHNPDLGYCQGMNFVAGLLLLVSNFREEECFSVLVCLMDHLGLAGFYGEKLPLFRRYLRACDMLVKETVPDLREHFKKENVNAPVYLHQWFLTLFINCFPLSMVTIIWDAIICEGLEVLLRIAVSILQVLKDSLLAMQFEEIIKFFKMMKTYNDEDGELNAFRIGQLLMKHTELVKVPQNILDELRSDAADDEPFVDYDETWEGCFIKGISCGGHTAINCEHCPTPGSEHPEMECNGQCIYDYKINGDHVLGACRGLEPTDTGLVDCGAHMAHSCTACVTRYTYHCPGGDRYCHGDCSWEQGDCGTCPELADAYAPSPLEAAAPEAEDEDLLGAAASPSS